MNVKKLLAALVLTLLCSVGASAQDEMIRVGLKYGGSAVKSAEFSSEYGLNFYDAVTGELLYTSAANESVSISESNAAFFSEGKLEAAADKLSVQSTQSAPIDYDGKAYRGYFLLEKGDSGITVINIVHINQYLYGVLGNEMGASFPAEALKAQAICAKNFVLGEKNRHSGDFDVCATTHCQVYSGVSGESEETVAAVEAVDGKAAYYDGEIVPLYFFATSGGKTESAKNVWGTDAEYLIGVDDPYEPENASRREWTTTLSAEEISSRLDAKGLGVGKLESISVDEVSPSGRVLKMTFNGTDGSRSVSREACRTAIGTDKLYSQCFTVSASGSAETAVLMTTDGAAEGNVALTADGVSEIEGKSVLTADGLAVLPSSSDASGSEFVFSGRGYGHGVGMSQWGAYGMAEQGYDYVDILTHYFSGIVVE